METDSDRREMHHRLTIALCVLLLLIGACGDSGEDAGDADVTVLPETTVVASEPVSDDGGGGEASPEHCPELVMAISSAANAAAAQVAGGAPMDLPAANMRAIADRVPEIRDDLLTLADAYDTFMQTLDEVGVDFSDPASMANLDEEAMEELDAAGEALDSEPVRDAQDRIQAFFDRECS